MLSIYYAIIYVVIYSDMIILRLKASQLYSQQFRKSQFAFCNFFTFFCKLVLDKKTQQEIVITPIISNYKESKK